MAFLARSSTMMTAEEFLEFPLPSDAGKAELVRGEVQVTPPPGAPHGAATTNLVLLLGDYIRMSGTGRVFGDSVGYELTRLPRTVRAPDASFVRAHRLPAEGVRSGFLQFAPDLAVEVLSPSETASALEQKLSDYLTSGTELIWVVDPAHRTVMVIPADAPVRWLQESDTLDGGTVLPGFSCKVAEIFEGIAREA